MYVMQRILGAVVGLVGGAILFPIATIMGTYACFYDEWRRTNFLSGMVSGIFGVALSGLVVIMICVSSGWTLGFSLAAIRDAYHTLKKEYKICTEPPRHPVVPISQSSIEHINNWALQMAIDNSLADGNAEQKPISHANQQFLERIAKMPANRQPINLLSDDQLKTLERIIATTASATQKSQYQALRQNYQFFLQDYLKDSCINFDSIQDLENPVTFVQTDKNKKTIWVLTLGEKEFAQFVTTTCQQKPPFNPQNRALLDDEHVTIYKGFAHLVETIQQILTILKLHNLDEKADHSLSQGPNIFNHVLPTPCLHNTIPNRQNLDQSVIGKYYAN